MLHPQLGQSGEPLATWQVDTDEIGEVAHLFSHHLASVRDSDQAATRLGLLWKKLAGTPRLARLVLEYAELQWKHAMWSDRARDRGEIRFLDRLWVAIGRPARTSEPATPRVSVEDHSLYDRWIDG